MFERMGLGGLFTWDDKSGQPMDQTRKRFSSLTQGANELHNAMTTFGSMTQPIVTGLRAAGGMFADFEAQMSVVSSKMGVLREKDPAAFAALSAEAKRLGATTSFTATQVGEGMEQLATAGFSAQEQLSMISGVLDTAAADGISLSRSSEIVAGVIRGMGLSAEDTARVTNTLASTSQSTMTDINKLGHSFSYAMPMARQYGMSVEELSSYLGLMGNTMIQSGRAGRNLSSLLVKLIKPNEYATGFMKKVGFTMTETVNGVTKMKPLARIVSELGDEIDKLEDPTERARTKFEIAGAEGLRAFNALRVGGSKAFQELHDKAKKAQGENLIAQMANERLNNLKGDIVIMKSAIEGFAIEFFGTFGSNGRSLIQGFTNSLSGVTDVLTILGSGKTWAEQEKALESARLKYGEVVVSIAIGLKEGIGMVKEWGAWIATKIKDIGTALGKSFGGDGIKGITKFAVGFVAASAAIIPLLAGIRVLGALTGIVTGVGRSFLSWPFKTLLIGMLLTSAVGIDSFGLLGKAVVGAGKFVAWVGEKFGAAGVAAVLLAPKLMTLAGLFGGIKAKVFLASVALGAFATQAALDWWDEHNRRVADSAENFREVAAAISSGFKPLDALERKLLNISEITDKSRRDFAWTMLRLTGSKEKVDEFERRELDSKRNRGRFQEMKDRALAENEARTTEAKAMDEMRRQGLSHGEATSQYRNVMKSADNAKASELDAELAGLGAAVGEGLADGEAGELLTEIAKNTGKDCDKKVSVKLDGREINKNLAKHKQDLKDRLGQQTSPWVRRVSAEQGSVS